MFTTRAWWDIRVPLQVWLAPPTPHGRQTLPVKSPAVHMCVSVRRLHPGHFSPWAAHTRAIAFQLNCLIFEHVYLGAALGDVIEGLPPLPPTPWKYVFMEASLSVFVHRYNDFNYYFNR